MIGISLFTGAGGLDLGASSAGLNILACVETDQDSCQTLKMNPDFSDKKIFNSDVSELDCRRILEFLPEKSAEKRIVIGGPPCQPFSKNGYWVRNQNRDVDGDPRNLVSEFLRCAEECEADAFILENVESILHPTNKHVAKYITDRGEAKGFGVMCCLVNSADYGVPQKRKRVFFFGIKNHRWTGETPEPTHGTGGARGLFRDLPDHLGVGNLIDKFSSEKFAEACEDTSGGTYHHELTHVLPGENYMCLAKLKNYKGRVFKSGSRFWNFLNKLHPEKTSITIAAQPGPWVGPFHWSNRRLRVPEAAAIQTFPESYRFAGSRRSIQKQIGNAVPVRLARHMTQFLLSRL